jgi:hypothetical protein
VKIYKHFFALWLVLIIAPTSLEFAAASGSVKKVAELKPKAVAKVTKKQATVEKKKIKGLVVGKNLKVGMTLDKAIALLGVPIKITVKRGTEPSLDSIAIKYASHGVVIHSLNGKQKVEAIELLPTFKGHFANGIKMGNKVPKLIENYGVPQSMSDSLARYPDKGIYFSLKKNEFVSAWIFLKNSKILSHKLFKSR